MHAVDELCARFASTVVERDQLGGTPKTERDALRESDLLGMTIPLRYGGQERPWSELIAVVHRFATVDPSIAHLFGFHHLMLATAWLYGQEHQWGSWFASTIRERHFWGNAQNPLDKRTIAEFQGNQIKINGRKSFCSGALDSDRLVISAYAGTAFVVGVVPTDRVGVTVYDDWDNIGQRQTDSGSVTFQDVVLDASEMLSDPGPLSTPRSTLRSCLAQLILSNIYAGVAAGALHTARHYHDDICDLRGLAFSPESEPDYLYRTCGDLWVGVEGARLLNERAGALFDRAWQRGDELTDAQRGELAVAIAAGKIASGRSALDVSTRIFEVMGARATHGALRLDRFWRNARTHTLHDPVDRKLVEVGGWALAAKWPTPSFYG